MNPIVQAILIAIIYGLFLFGLIKLFGIKYTELTKSSNHIKKGIFYPVGIAGLLLVIVSAMNGWLVPAFTPPSGYSAPWMWIIPASLTLGAILRFMHSRWHVFTRASIFYLVAGVILVGFSEELLARGLLVHFIDQAGVPQFAVALISSVIFGLLHGMNYFNGQSRKTTIAQIILTSITGMGLYASFILSGTLWVPIILHAFFDLSLLSQGGIVIDLSKDPPKAEATLALIFYTGSIAALIALILLAVVS